MSRKAIMLLSDGVEEVEAVTPLDILTRVGVGTTVVSLSGSPVKAAYGLVFLPDATLEEVDWRLFDAVILPGGMKNAETLATSSTVADIVRRHFEAGKLVAAICAAPAFVLGEATGLVRGRRAIGDPGCNDRLQAAGAELVDQHVVVDGNLITARGPGAALQFGLAIADYLMGSDATAPLRDRWGLKG